ncbi:unnamed protein product [Protopolystoma xenopodis]|uniref:Uncharacterized protein n=1 Tax=Protopolystoma xenopodis TaxID=117903 RepID=A0A448WZR1_9PLAT|nr:unnamed protein product [Protopolystoma xenopodis]
MQVIAGTPYLEMLKCLILAPLNVNQNQQFQETLSANDPVKLCLNGCQIIEDQNANLAGDSETVDTKEWAKGISWSRPVQYELQLTALKAVTRMVGRIFTWQAINGRKIHSESETKSWWLEEKELLEASAWSEVMNLLLDWACENSEFFSSVHISLKIPLPLRGQKNTLTQVNSIHTSFYY